MIVFYSKQPKRNKLSTPFNPQPYQVTDVKDTLVTAENPITNHRITRNETHFKKIPLTAPTIPKIIDTEEDNENERGGNQDMMQPTEKVPTALVTPSSTSSIIESQREPRKEYPNQIRRPLHEWRKY